MFEFKSKKFKNFKIRKQKKDYLKHFFLHATHTGSIYKGVLGLGFCALLLTSFAFANAAPTSDPPNSNVTPNFNGVNISTKAGNNDQEYFEAELRQDGSNPTFKVRSQENANNYGQIQVGGVNQPFSIFQKFGSGDLESNALAFLKTTGVIMRGYRGIILSAESGAVNLIASTNLIASAGRDMTLTAGDDFTLTTADDLSLTANGDGNVSIRATGDEIDLLATTIDLNGTIYADGDLYVDRFRSNSDAIQFNETTYFHDTPLIDSGTNFLGIAGEGYLKHESRVSSSFSRNSAQSGRVTETCNYRRENGNDGARAYGNAFACGYRIAGNTNGSINVTTSKSASGRSCHYDYTSNDINSSGSFHLILSTLCYRAEFVGL